MKKLFYLFAVAVVAISLASCNKKDEPASKDFVIEVSDVQAGSAHVKVTPSKADAFYFASVVSQDELDYYKMTLEEYAADDMEYYPEHDYSFSDLAQSGVYETNLSLDPETKYYAYAFYFNKSWEILSDIAFVEFTTPKLVVKETVNVQGEGTLYDMIDLGYLLAIEANLDPTGNSYITLAFLTDQANATFTEEDIDSYYGYGAWVVADAKNEEYYKVVTAEVTGAYNADSTAYAVAGNIVATNGVKYILDLTCPVDDESDAAPAKKLARKAAVPAKKIALKK